MAGTQLWLGSPILWGHLRNILLLITLLRLRLLIPLLPSLLFARRLINTMSGTRGLPAVIHLFVVCLLIRSIGWLFDWLVGWLIDRLIASLFLCVLACLRAWLFVRLFIRVFVRSFLCVFVCSLIRFFWPKGAKGENEPLHGKKLSWGRRRQEGSRPQEAHDARIQPRRRQDGRI